MLYAIHCEDIENSAQLRGAARDPHRARLDQLISEGRLILAGPYPAIDSNDPGPAGVTGSLIVAEFDSLEDAQAWAYADPFLEAGVWQQVSVRPFKKNLP